MKPYYEDESVCLYLGDMRKVLPQLDLRPDCIVADPPYGETSLAWDRWPDGWPAVAAEVSASMWCFGSMRMLLARAPEFAAWRLSQDIVWEKNNGSGFTRDRFRRVHEHATHWYGGNWRDIHHEAPRHVPPGGTRSRTKVGEQVRKHRDTQHHLGYISPGTWTDDGTRLITSVIRAANLRGSAVHPTEKPVGLLDPLIRYACPPGGLVLDPFAGSGSTAVAARLSGRRAVLIEADRAYCDVIVRRLAQDCLPMVEASLSARSTNTEETTKDA